MFQSELKFRKEAAAVAAAGGVDRAGMSRSTFRYREISPRLTVEGGRKYRETLLTSHRWKCSVV